MRPVWAARGSGAAVIDELITFLADYAVWLAAFSLLSLVVASLLAAWFIGQLPADYFTFRERHPADGEHWLMRIVLIITKNVIGVILLAAGFIMLFTPGQGLLTLLAGITLTDFPGKYALERRLARQQKVMGALNWLRARRGQPPFERPD